MYSIRRLGFFITVALVLANCTPGVQSGNISSQFAGVQAATAISPTAVVISWTKSSDYSSYEIYSNTQKDPLTESVFSSATIESLTPETKYSFKVTGKGSNGVGGDTEYGVTTWPRFTGIDRVYKNSDGAMVVEWTYAYPASQFQIFYNADSPPTAANTGNWAVPNATTRTNSYVFKNLAGSTTYYFAVHAMYRDSEFERPDKAIAGATNSSFPLPFFDLPKITIGALPTITILPVVTDQFPAANYESHIFKDGVEIADPVHGAGKATFASTIPLALGKVDNIELKVTYHDSKINETLSIPGLSTYLKGTVPYLDLPPSQSESGPAFMGQSTVVGDFNCDGYDDLAIGLPFAALAQFGATNAQSGAVYVYYGGLNSNGMYVLNTTAPPSINPAHPGKDPQVLSFPDLSWHAQFGFSLAKGNLNGDKNGIYSCDDLAVGAPGQVNPDGLTSGNVFVFFGTANVGLKAPATVSSFPQNSETCDGRTAGASCTGVRLWPDYRLWPAAQFGSAFSATLGSASVGNYIRYGASVAFIGDFNADGNEDLAIGAPNAPWDGISPAFIGSSAWNPENVGYVAMYFGSRFGLGYETPVSNTTYKFRWLKIFPPIAQTGMHFGASLAGGDIDGAHRVFNSNSQYVGGGDLVVGAPGFFYVDPDSTLFPMTSSGPDLNVSVSPVDGGWWGSTNRATAVNSRYGFAQSFGSRARGTAFAFFGRSLSFHSTTPNSNSPPLDSFWDCGRRGMSAANTHFSCLADAGDYRILFPRDDRSYGFATSLAVVGDKSARDATDTLKCIPAAYPGPLTSIASGACRDANGDGFADIIVMASDADAPAGDGRTSTGALWQFFGNFDHVFEAGNSDNFYPAGPGYYNITATCQNFALSALAPGNSGFSANDRKACAPTKLIPNSIPSLAAMGQYPSSISVGDITRDGLLDVAVGAPRDNTMGSNAGAAYVFTSLRGSGITTNFKKLVRNSTDQDDLFGYALAIGDFNAPGQNQELTGYTCSSDGSDTCDPTSINFGLIPFYDVAVGAPFENGHNPAGGGVHLFNAAASVLPAIRTTSDVDIYDSIASMQDYRYGETRIVGDINGDGYDDAVTHVQSFNSAGQQTFDAVVYFGSAYGLVTTSFCLANQGRVFASGSHSDECYPSRTHAAGITNADIVLPQKLVRPNNVSPGWAEIAYSAGDINGDGFADVAFIDPYYSSTSGSTAGYAQLLVYYGTRAGLQDIVVPGWKPANNDPQIVSRNITVPTKGYANQNYTDMFYQKINLVSTGDFNGDGYADLVISNPEGTGPSLVNSTTSKDAFDGHTEAIQDIGSWPINSVLTGTLWRCPANSTLVGDCVYGSGVWDHGYVFIFYGSQQGVASPSMYTAGSANVDILTPGTKIDFVYNTEDSFGQPTASASTNCSSLSPTGGCIPVVSVLRNPVMVNFKNGYQALSHMFGSAVSVVKINKNDPADSLLISAPGYEHLNCLNYSDPSASSPQLDQGRIYVYRGSNFGVIAGAKTDYYPTPTDGDTSKCTAMAQTDDTGLGFDAFGRVRAIHMGLAGAPTSGEQSAATSAAGTGQSNSRTRRFGWRMVNAGDLNGDGFEDMVFMAPYENVYDQNSAVVVGAGAGYVMYGPLCPSDNDTSVQTYIQDPSRLNQQAKFSDAGITLAASCAGKTLAPQKFRIKDVIPYQTGDPGSTNSHYGLSIAAGRIVKGKLTGDINLDGWSDIVVGSPYWNDLVNSTTGVGRGIVLFGSPGGLYTDDYPSAVVETLSLNRTKPYVLVSPQSITDANFFYSNLSTGDVNGDKSMDLMTPSFNYDGVSPIPGIDLGAFFLFY